MRSGVAHDDDPAVVRNGQPPVRISAPGVGQLHTVEKRALAATGATPQSEGAVDVQPRATLMSGSRDVGKRIDRAGVHFACLRANDGRPGHAAQNATKLVGAHAALYIGWNLLQPPAEAEHPQR